MTAVAKLLRWANRGVRSIARWRARRWLARYDPRLPGCWEAFKKRVEGKVYAFHPERARLILTMLERHRPKRVLELGAGTSTAWFAAYARKHAATVVSVDQHEGWLNAAVETARPIGPVQPVLAGVEIEPGLGGRYAIDLPEADFIYIDGPWVNVKTDMPRGKGVNLDVPRLLRGGRRPAVIMLDGRTDTVDYMRREGLVADYDFYPEFVYCQTKGDWLGALSFRRQSIFVLREAAGSARPGRTRA